MIRAINRSQEELNSEWDQIARVRFDQIQSGQDISALHVLPQLIDELHSGCDLSVTLDIGCGPGFLTCHLSETAGQVIGLDPSRESIKLAHSLNARSNIEYFEMSVEDYASIPNSRNVTTAVANMTLMTAASLDGFVEAVVSVLRPHGCFIFTITHPCFWPLYWGYADEPWFDYNSEVMIEAPFRISLDRDESFRTTHVHRPLHKYVSILSKNGFRIEFMLEPMPTPQVSKLYPSKWLFPRFLGMRCRLEDMRFRDAATNSSVV